MHKIGFVKHMTAHKRHYGGKSEHIWIKITPGKSVFVNDNFKPSPLKANSEHQAYNAYKVDYSGYVYNKTCNKIQFFSKIKIPFGVHSVKKEKTKSNVHYKK